MDDVKKTGLDRKLIPLGDLHEFDRRFEALDCTAERLRRAKGTRRST